MKIYAHSMDDWITQANAVFANQPYFIAGIGSFAGYGPTRREAFWNLLVVLIQHYRPFNRTRSP